MKVASKILRDLRITEVVKLDMVVKDGKVSSYRDYESRLVFQVRSEEIR